MTERKTPIIWSPEATDDLDQLWDYYFEAAGRTVADDILHQIGQVVAILDEFPFAGRARDKIQTGLRSLSAGSQIVFYRLKNDRPEIVRVLDGRRDIDEIFSEDG